MGARLAWNDTIDMLRRGQDPFEKYPERWTEGLSEKFALCEQNREQVLEQGGLHVVGTERHDARRIDNQLRGRAGRQGDPGSSRFYLSLQDDLMRRFGGQRVANIMESLGVEDDIPIEAGLAPCQGEEFLQSSFWHSLASACRHPEFF